MTTNDRGVLQAAKWHRREFLLALGAVGALAGCGGGGNDGPVPVPAGTKLFDLKFVDAQTAYGVGKEGLIARTDDGGQTWRRLPSESTTDLVSVFPVNRELVIVNSDDQAVLRTVDGGANWQTIRQGYGSATHTAWVAFATDADHVALRVDGVYGRFIGPSYLVITTNGGLGWLTTQPPDSQIPWEPQFTRSGFLFILYGPVSGGAQPLWVSDDFGRSFRQTPLSGVAAGSFGERGIWLQMSSGGTANQPARVAVSQDAFRTWTEVPMQIDGLAIDAQPRIWLKFLDAAGLGWASTDTGLLHTTDGGRRWTVVAAPPEVSRIVFGRALDGMGWVTNANGVAQWFTIDAGASWRRFDRVPAETIEAWNAQYGSAVSWVVRDGGGGLLAGAGPLRVGYTWQRSLDDGRSWRTLL